MNPWIPIAVSVITTVIVGLVGFIAKRELARVAADIAELKKLHAAIATELKNRISDCDARFLSKEMFNSLESSRKEVDKMRRESDGRLEGLIRDLLAKYGG